MNKRWVIFIAFVVIIASLLVTVFPERSHAGPKTLKFSYTMPKGKAVAAGFEWWGPEFERRTNGRYKVEIYPGSTLVGFAAALDSVKAGVAEIVMTAPAVFPKEFPLTIVTSLPTLGWPAGSVKNFHKSFAAWWELFNNTPEIQAEFKDYKLLWPYQLDPSNLVSKKKKVTRAEDFRGMKVGGTGHVMELVTAHGGARVHQIPPQTYLNLDKGVIDAAFLTFAMAGDYKIQEIAEYFYTQNFGSGTIVVLMNLETWNAMPPEDQRIMEESWRDAAEPCAQGMVEDHFKGMKLFKDAGRTVAKPTAEEEAAWGKASEIVFQKWIEDCKALGAGNPEKILDEWRRLVKKYQ